MRRLALCLLLVGLPASAVDRNLLVLADPEVNFALGLRVGDLAQSPLLRPLLEQALAESPAAAVLGDAVNADTLSRFDEALIVGRVEPGDEGAPEDALILLSGDLASFAWQDLLCSGGCSQLAHGGLQIQSPAHTDDEQPSFVQLDDRYAAFGAVDKLQAVIDRRAAPQSRASADALQAWVSDLGGSHLWLAAKGPFEMPDEAAENPMFSGMTQGLEGFGFGLTVGENVDVGLEILTDGDESARNLYDLAQGFLAMAAMSAANDPEQAEAAAFLQSLELEQKGGRVSAALSIPGDQLIAQVRSHLDQQAGSGEIAIDGTDDQTAVSAADEPEARPETAPVHQESTGVPAKNGITIHGLDPQASALHQPQKPRRSLK